MADESERFEQGRAAFNRGEYFLAHERWEEVWREDADAEKRIHLQGLIQIAAGLHHLQKRRTGPAAGLLRKGLAKVSKRRKDPSGDLRTDLLAGQVERLLVELEAPKKETTDVTAAAELSHLRF